MANYCKKMKQLVDKIEENSRFIIAARKSANFGVGEKDKISVWESTVESEGTPLAKFHASWAKVKTEERRKVQQKEMAMDEYDFIPKMKKKEGKKKEEEEEFKGLLGGDSEDDDSMVSGDFLQERKFKLSIYFFSTKPLNMLYLDI